MKTLPKIISVFTVIFLFLSLHTGQVIAQGKPKPWDVPAKFNSMNAGTNLKDASVINIGKVIWIQQCKTCHGVKGLGDGPRAAALKANPGDFSTPAFQGQSDGDLYYKAIIGRDEMPNFEKKIPSESDRWSLVAYIRTMKK